MIKVDKDLSTIPQSLIPAFLDFFPELQVIPTKTRNTHKKRLDIISNGAYIDNDTYNSLYKREDIKTLLNKIYKGKCAYCEMKVEQSHVEHYRPKNKYYWLAFSWDNLILACSTCNIYKGDSFEIDGNEVTFDSTEANLRDINTSSSGYDLHELPRLVNPETTDPLGQIVFQRNGLIESENDRFAYTIMICKIDRKWLNDERRSLLEIYERDIRSALLENRDPYQQQEEIKTIVRKFIRDSEDDELPFLAFRRFAISAS